MLKRLGQLLRQIREDLRFRVAKYLAVRQVTKVLKQYHVQELAQTPRNEWPMMVRQHQSEIHAVANGQIDIVDRRSWAYAWLPSAIQRLNQPLRKPTPFNIRRFAETPIPRRAINLIKNAVLSMDWEIKPIREKDDDTPERETRVQIATECFKRPNNFESFRDVFEAFLEDYITFGAGVIEPRLTPWFQRPFKLWAVDCTTISIFLNWTESRPDLPRYAQETGLSGDRKWVAFYADELMYVKDNNRTSTPFGLGKCEVAFNTISAFLSAQDMAGRLGGSVGHHTFMWWANTINPRVMKDLKNFLGNDAEGQSATLNPIAGAPKPEIVDAKHINADDLKLEWQEFLIRVIANAFDLSPLSLGLERDVNRNTGEVMTDSDFRNCVVPCAKRLEESNTRVILHGKLGWRDLEFAFIGLEDPDMKTRADIQKIEWSMNSITPNEIRAKKGEPRLPGKWGDLNFGQYAILMQEAMARAKGQFAPTSGAGGGSSFGGGGGFGGGMGTGTSGGMGMPSLGAGANRMDFNADDVAQMQPDEIQMYQDLGILPPSDTLQDQMEQQQPGILDQLSDELKEFFEKETVEDQDIDSKQPAPITNKNQKYQQALYKKSQHKPADIELAVNRRGNPTLNRPSNRRPRNG